MKYQKALGDPATKSRELMFGENQYDVFKHGANALVFGDYLTTGGASAEDDIKAVTALGYEIAFACHQ